LLLNGSYIRSSILKERELQEAIDCIYSTFLDGEPMTKALGITKSEFDYFATVFIKKQLEMAFQ
jgi:hypothetical protein